ncbi:MAG: ABC transporter substrate-binding protein [Deltaproteobacteria bacterium]|nr:ABC transporter substrate-binding protein [Deltaproteobacteria bacterium]
MKRSYFVPLWFFLMCGLILGLGFQPSMAAEKSKYGGILKYNHTKTAGIVGNPLKIRGWNHEYIDNVLETLIIPSNKKMGEFEPQLATGWELAPDKSCYIFKLRKGVEFHDGTDFNAQAVKWNLDMWVKSKRPRLDKVKSIEVLDDYTVRVNLSGWDAVTLSDFSKDTYIVSPTAWKKHGEKWVDYHPVGTGPFKLVEFRRNVHLKYKRFEGYWKKGLPYLDGLFVTQIPDPMTAMAALKRGEIDAWTGVDPISGSELKKTGKWTIYTNPAIHRVIQFNSTDPKSIWSDKRMREALEYAIDKERIAKVMGRGFFFPIYEIVHSIPPGAGTVPRKYNPEKARQLIREAGREGIRVKMHYFAGFDQDAFTAIQANLKEVGITLEAAPVTGAAYHKRLFEPAPVNDLILGNQRGSRSELLVSVDETLAPGSVFFQGVKRPKGFVEILNRALQQEDRNKILEGLYELERLAYGEAMFVPLVGTTFITVNAPYVKDTIWFWGSMPYPHLERAWLDKKK